MPKKRAADPCEICPVYKLFARFKSKGEIADLLQHLMQARREVLLAIRSLIDAALATTEEAEKKVEKIRID